MGLYRIPDPAEDIGCNFKYEGGKEWAMFISRSRGEASEFLGNRSIVGIELQHPEVGAAGLVQ